MDESSPGAEDLTETVFPENFDWISETNLARKSGGMGVLMNRLRIRSEVSQISSQRIS